MPHVGYNLFSHCLQVIDRKIKGLPQKKMEKMTKKRETKNISLWQKSNQKIYPDKFKEQKKVKKKDK